MTIPDENLHRTHYRQSASQEDGLLAYLGAPQGEEVRAELGGMSYVQLEAPLEQEVRAQLVDLCIQGASLLVDGKAVTGLDEGSIVSLRVEHPREAWSIEVDSVVRSKRGTARVRLGLEFRGGGLEERLVEGAGRYFNRRRGTRIDLAGMRVEGRLNIESVIFPVRVNDLSVFGASLRLPQRWAAALREDDVGHMSLLLPSEGAPVELRARPVRWLYPDDGDLALLGVGFVSGDSLAEQQQRQRLERFVESYLARRLNWAG